MRGHYESLAAEYDEHWTYSPSYVSWMSARLAETLRLSRTDRMADIGCGTGLFTRQVAELVDPVNPVLAVDPSPAMLRQVSAVRSPGLTPVLASAEDVAEGRADLPYNELDAVWLKESVHHVADPAGTLRGLAGSLAPGGRLLVVMLPTTIKYPLFHAALDRFEELQPDPQHIALHLETAGLDAQVLDVEHELRLNREKYFDMVRARYMSLLSTFTDSEISAGIDEMRAAHPEPVLTFPDRFAFVLATKGRTEH